MTAGREGGAVARDERRRRMCSVCLGRDSACHHLVLSQNYPRAPTLSMTQNESDFVADSCSFRRNSEQKMLECDQSNYSLCIVFSYRTSIAFGPTGNSAFSLPTEKTLYILEPDIEVSRMMTCRGDIAIRNFRDVRSPGRRSVVNII